jgi:hypothetical protein
LFKLPPKKSNCENEQNFLFNVSYFQFLKFMPFYQQNCLYSAQCCCQATLYSFNNIVFYYMKICKVQSILLLINCYDGINFDWLSEVIQDNSRWLFRQDWLYFANFHVVENYVIERIKSCLATALLFMWFTHFQHSPENN